MTGTSLKRYRVVIAETRLITATVTASDPATARHNALKLNARDGLENDCVVSLDPVCPVIEEVQS